MQVLNLERARKPKKPAFFPRETVIAANPPLAVPKLEDLKGDRVRFQQVRRGRPDA